MSRAAEPAGGTDPVRAVGRLGPDGPWVGFAPSQDGYRLVFGLRDGSVQPDPTREAADRRAGLVAAAIAFFLAALDTPPPELEATHADIAGLIARLVVREAEDAAPGREAVDAIDDGLPADAVAIRLQQLLPPGADALTILRARAQLVTAAGTPAAEYWDGSG